MWDNNYTQRVAACDVGQIPPFGRNDNKVKDQPATTQVLPVTEAKQKAMQEYANKLRKKFPHMKKQRLMKKVAEYFKVKLV